jgi:hypothetical protein
VHPGCNSNSIRVRLSGCSGCAGGHLWSFSFMIGPTSVLWCLRIIWSRRSWEFNNKLGGASHL